MPANISRREALAALAAAAALPAGAADEKPKPLVIVVTDPLAAPNSCPCVEGYAQRDYDKLGKFLEAKLNRPVAVFYADSLAGALAKKTNGKCDLVIGKDSVVRAQGPDSKFTVTHLAALEGKDGKTTQTGYICVAAADKAVTPADLKGYKILFGSKAADEKHAAAIRLVKESGVPVPETLDTCPTCTDAATKALELAKGGEKVAAVISSYAKLLLEGCGTIKKGDLRLIGETEEVPFIACFATNTLTESDCAAVKAALLTVGTDKALCKALETKGGFVQPAKKK
jgi:ABC-type phosphate/phosphonate transport system substrate-binding protein